MNKEEAVLLLDESARVMAEKISTGRVRDVNREALRIEQLKVLNETVQLSIVLNGTDITH